jgi:ribosomal protein S18 acetylase RimI-like enzyme
MTVTLRVAVPTDAATLADVAGATFALACPPGTSPAAVAAFVEAHLSRERFATYLADAARTLLVAEDGTGPVGYAMLVATPDGSPADDAVARAVRHRPTVELSKFYVRAAHHGGAVAAPLMVAVLAAARARGASSAWLGVNQLNARAQRFYTRSGFTRMGTKAFLVGDELHDDFVMERALDGILAGPTQTGIESEVEGT